MILILGCMLLSKAYCGQPGWELKRDLNGIVIYTKESPDSPLKEYRVHALIEGSLEDVYAFLTDLEYRPQWINHCVGLEIIDTAGDGRIRYHTGYDMPWPLQDRDLVVEAGFSMQLADGSAHLLTRNADLHYPPGPGIIRMPRYKEEVILEAVDPGTTRFRSEGFADPGGKVPAWVVNMFLVDNLYESVVHTRECLAEGWGKRVPEQD